MVRYLLTQIMQILLKNLFNSILVILFISLTFHNLFGAEKPDIRFRKQPEIRQIKPPKPVKIKLHRNNKGEYSWDITGDNVDEIIKADRKLRKLLKVE
ncbi:MAG: hypothetical protein ACK4Z9_00230 [Thermodesulfovibrionales bacterium]